MTQIGPLDLPKIDPALQNFEPHESETWIPGFAEVRTLLHPYERLREEYGEEALENGTFDWGLFNDSVGRALLEIQLGRLTEAFKHCGLADVEPQWEPTIRFESIGGRRSGAIYARVQVDRTFVRWLRRYLFSEDGSQDWPMARLAEGEMPRHLSDFASWIRQRYESRPGFLPYESKEAADWVYETRGFSDFSVRADDRGHKLGTVIEFIITHYEDNYGEEWDAADLYYELHAEHDTAIYPEQFWKGSLPEPA